VHSDIGAGNGNVALSYISLRWMLRKAKAAGLPIEKTIITSRDSEIRDAPLRVPKDPIPNEYRGFLNGDRFHYTVTATPGHNNPPAGALRETEQDEEEAARVKDLPRREAEPISLHETEKIVR
jgi:hypothetical protein